MSLQILMGRKHLCISNETQMLSKMLALKSTIQVIWHDSLRPRYSVHEMNITKLEAQIWYMAFHHRSSGINNHTHVVRRLEVHYSAALTV
jgi:hypothetical protein